MSDSLTRQFNRATAPSEWLRFIAPLALSILVAWASVSYFAGDITRRVSAQEAAQQEQKETNKTFPTRSEIEIANTAIIRELNAIHDDVRSIRNRLERK